MRKGEERDFCCGLEYLPRHVRAEEIGGVLVGIKDYYFWGSCGKFPDVIDFTRYYGNGDEILPRHLNTLDQLFGRIMVTADSEEALWRILNNIRETVTVRDDKGEEMIQWSTFDYLYSRFLSKNKE